MGLLKPIENGRMYPGWWRWNPIAGCLHDCSYCYLKSLGLRFGRDMMMPVINAKYLKDNLGSGRKVLIGSSGDMWGEWVEESEIGWVLMHCTAYLNNQYMFLTKNPGRYDGFEREFGYLNRILGATIETDITSIAAEVSDAPDVLYRLDRMAELKDEHTTMISIEPGMKFSQDFAVRLKSVAPDIVYIGVDSGNNWLPEPTPDELRSLITELRTFADVRLKKGIERLLPDMPALDKRHES